MSISLKNESTFLRWRRLVTVHDDSQLREPCAALDEANIPHIVGLHYRYKKPTGKPREAEHCIMVPFQHYTTARSLLVTTAKTPLSQCLS